MAEDAPLPSASSGEMDAEYDFDRVGVDQDLTGDGGVVKRILRAGEGWETPETGDDVSVHYVGTLTDGTKFDSSRDRGNAFNFKLGQGAVIKGWDKGVAGMKKGELATLTCKPEYAYGAAGSPPTIPPDSTLVFEVELLGWKSVKDVTGDGGVIKTILEAGKGWQTPKPEDELLVTFSARLRPPPASDAPASAKQRPPTAEEQGLPVVAASPEGGAVFSLGSAPCTGLAAGLKGMKPHERARFLLTPPYAAGLAEVPADGSLLEVEAALTALHAVTHPADGVTKKVVQETEGSYARPNAGSTVRLTIAAASPDGATVYEAAHEVEYVTDDEKVPEGVELAVATMREGERAIVTVSDPSLTVAPAGAVAGGGVPPGTTGPVAYDITLTSFDKAKERWEMNNAEKVAAALAAKEKGNAAYKAGNLARAVRHYTTALEAAESVSERDLAPGMPDLGGLGGSPTTTTSSATTSASAPSTAALLSQAREVKKAASLNLAAAELKRGNWFTAAQQATKVLDLDPSNVKGLYRRAQARMALGDLLEAECDVRAGLMSSPDNTDLAALQRKLKVRMRECNKKDAALYSKMFAGLGKGASDDAPAAPAAQQEDAPASAAASAAPVVQAAA